MPFNKPVESPPEFLEWKADPSPANHEKLFKTLEPTINSALMSFANNDPQFRTRARVLAQQALRTYDPKHGASLNTHVYNTLKRLQRVRTERASALHMPENIRADEYKIRSFSQEYAANHGVEPSLLLIADNLGLSQKRIEKTLRGGEISLETMSGEKSDLPAMSQKTPADVWMDYVYHDLPETDRKIFEWATGRGGTPILPKQEMAQRLRISPAAVSQRITKMAQRLSEVPS